ncbi:MAG: GAF domain-containing protein [Desulfosarcina sp.]|jgi:GAF domain-containing protein
MQRENHYLQLLLDITKTITSARTTDDVFDLIVSRIPEVVGVDAATIRLLDPTGKKLILKASSGLSEKYLKRGPIDAEESVLYALKGTPIAIVDAANDNRIQYPRAALQEGIESLLVAPIPIQGDVGGILRLLSRKRREFNQLEIEFVAALAEQCGICIENARIYDQQQRQLEYFKAVCEISKNIGKTRQLDNILDFIVKTIPNVMDVKACTIRLIEPSKGKLELKAAYGLSNAYLHRGPLDDEMATYFILKGEPVLMPDATSDVHTLYHKDAAKEGVGSIIAVPIAIQEETIGMLRVLSAEQRFFSESDINFAMAIAEQSGVAIQNAIDYQKMTELLETCRSKHT